MTKRDILNKTHDFIYKTFKHDKTGHDWYHLERVWKIATRIAREEKADLFIVQMAALLHDVGDYKLEPDRKDRQEEKVSAWLKKVVVPEKQAGKILHIVTHMSFSKNFLHKQELSIEGKIVQDADRIDAMGAIGIMRSFVYAGAHGIPPYIPGIAPRIHATIKSYKTHEASSLNHFYEKLLVLKNHMNTRTAKKMAIERHNVMLKYLDNFLKEWDGKK